MPKQEQEKNYVTLLYDEEVSIKEEKEEDNVSDNENLTYVPKKSSVRYNKVIIDLGKQRNISGLQYFVEDEAHSDLNLTDEDFEQLIPLKTIYPEAVKDSQANNSNLKRKEKDPLELTGEGFRTLRNTFSAGNCFPCKRLKVFF